MTPNITAYSEWEAQKIGNLKWYNDKYLINEIIRLLKKYHSSNLFDICCGTGQLYPKILKHYKKIYAVDLSNYMLAHNKLNNFFEKNIEFICDDAINYLQNNKVYIKYNDILLKNCLQFLDLSQLERVLKEIKFEHIFLINTINLSEDNLFDFLRNYKFDFVLRTHNYLTLNNLDSFCYKIGNIVETKIIKQEISLVEWLLYHDSNKEKVLKFIDFLNLIDIELINKLGIIKKSDEFIVLRYQKIYCIEKIK